MANNYDSMVHDIIFVLSITNKAGGNSNNTAKIKMATFRKVNLEISRGNGYGQYIITANYRGKEVKVHTTDSECYDWLNDDSNKEKHQEAKRYAYNAVLRAYENM